MSEGENEKEERTLKERISIKNERIVELEIENKKLSLEVEELEKEIKEAKEEADNDDF